MEEQSAGAWAGSEAGDGPLEAASASYDDQTAAYDATSGYYYGEAASYDESNTNYDYYAGVAASQEAYYSAEGMQEPGNYEAGYYGGYYESGDIAAGEYAPESPTNASLEGTDWYQEAETLESGGEIIGDVDELQIAHSLEVYGDDELATQWNAAEEGAPESPAKQQDSLSQSKRDGEVTNQIEGELVQEAQSQPSQTKSDSQPGSSPKKSKKTREDRIKKRQELLEKQEEAKSAAEDAPKPLGSAKKSGLTRKSSFVAREKAKLHLKMRIARAISRKRMPYQVRILTEPRKHASPLEKYFGGPIEAVLSDIFWSAIKGDIDRIKFLVDIEGVSPADGTLDPWGLGQTPLHWAAKGGHVSVINYLLKAGANPRGLDENGSLPLHLSCWAGHVDATIALLRASNTKDLFLPDYDGGLAPLDWATIRGHHQVIKGIEKYEDTLWLPKFVEDLVRGIVRYKIKLYKDPPKVKGKAAALAAATTSAAPAATNAGGDVASTPKAAISTAQGDDKVVEAKKLEATSSPSKFTRLRK